MTGLVTGYLVFAAGVLLLVHHRHRATAPRMPLQLLPADGQANDAGRTRARTGFEADLPDWLERLLARYRHQLLLTGQAARSQDERTASQQHPKTLRRFLLDKLACSVLLPLTLTIPSLAVLREPPPLPLLAALAFAGFFVPDLGLRRQVSKRREQVFLDLPEALAMIALGLGAGQSLRQALALAARDTPGPLGHDIAQALTRARRQPGLDERRALVQVAHETGEPHLIRFAELLASKESPYLDFLATHAEQARSEQQRRLEQAADRAYLNMHAPLAPLLATLVLVVAYGFLHLLEGAI